MAIGKSMCEHCRKIRTLNLYIFLDILLLLLVLQYFILQVWHEQKIIELVGVNSDREVYSLLSTERGGRHFVTLESGQNSVNALIDSGAQTSILPESMVKNLEKDGLAFFRKVTSVVGVAKKSVPAKVYMVTGLSINECMLRGVEIATIDGDNTTAIVGMNIWYETGLLLGAHGAAAATNCTIE